VFVAIHSVQRTRRTIVPPKDTSAWRMDRIMSCRCFGFSCFHDSTDGDSRIKGKSCRHELRQLSWLFAPKYLMIHCQLWRQKVVWATRTTKRVEDSRIVVRVARTSSSLFRFDCEYHQCSLARNGLLFFLFYLLF
jgi:hypothetical protein